MDICINDLNGDEIIGTFYGKELQKTNQQEFRIEKVIKIKMINYISNGKIIIVHLIAGLIKKTQSNKCTNMRQYFPKPYETFSGDINVKVDLSNYATETDIKNISHVDTSSFALKSNLANLKTEVDKLDIDKLVPVPVDLSKLSDVVKNDVVKKTVYDKLVAKVNSIDTSVFVLKTKYDTEKTELGKKIAHTSGLVKKTDYNGKIIETRGKIPSISGLTANAALTAVENKIPNISSLVKKQIIIQKLLKLTGNLLIIIMINTLQLQILILQLLMFLMQHQHKQSQ